MLATLLFADNPVVASCLVGITILGSLALGCLVTRVVLDRVLHALQARRLVVPVPSTH